MIISIQPILATYLEQAMLALGVGILVSILLRITYRRLGQRKKKNSSKPIATQPRPDTPWSGAYQDADAQLSRKEVELHEMTRDATATIDNKMILLQQLIAQSQKQIDRLEELLKESEASSSQSK